MRYITSLRSDRHNATQDTGLPNPLRAHASLPKQGREKERWRDVCGVATDMCARAHTPHGQRLWHSHTHAREPPIAPTQIEHLNQTIIESPSTSYESVPTPLTLHQDRTETLRRPQEVVS